MENGANVKGTDALLCPQCGGIAERTEDGFSCPYCGYVERRKPELTQEEKRELSQKIAAAREAGRIRAQEEHAYERSEAAKEQRLKKARRTRVRTIVIWTGIILLIIATIVWAALH